MDASGSRPRARPVSDTQDVARSAVSFEIVEPPLIETGGGPHAGESE
jgi:hypothetical protein